MEAIEQAKNISKSSKKAAEIAAKESSEAVQRAEKITREFENNAKNYSQAFERAITEAEERGDGPKKQRTTQSEPLKKL
jgi:catalase (peroxidase I)